MAGGGGEVLGVKYQKICAEFGPAFLPSPICFSNGKLFAPQ